MMNAHLLEVIDETIPKLEELRLELLRVEATPSNRRELDQAYDATVKAIEKLRTISSTKPTHCCGSWGRF